MSNIRVDVGYAIHDGSELKFRSPVDCSAVTGLIVYHPGNDGNTTSTVFTLADAHGNNVGLIDHLFAENVVVNVILDVAHRMAFVQNADTNTYIEENFLKKSGVDGQGNWSVNMNGHRMTGLPLPQAGSEPATKEFVENFTVEGSTYVATDDNKDGNIVLRPYVADADELEFRDHIKNKNNPHGATAEQIGAIPKTGGDVSGKLNFGNANKGLSWTMNDGTVFHLQPYVSNNIIQFVLVPSGGTAKNAFGIKSDGTIMTDYPIPVAAGGTGAKNAADARANLGITPSNIGALPTAGGTLTGWLKFDGATIGHEWKTADGTTFQVRPYTAGNIFQIVTRTTDGKTVASLDVKNDGSVQVGKPAEFRQQLGAAPSGYGYGEAMPIRNYTESELEQWFSTIIAGMPNLSTKQVAFYCKDGTLVSQGGFYATIYKYDNTCASVVAHVYNNGFTVHKDLLDNVWTPFEWVNPPMSLGVEYRTTERWQGKVVYTRLIDCGAFPAAGASTWKSFGYGDGITKVIRVSGWASGGATIPYYEESLETRISGSYTADTDQAWVCVSVVKGSFSGQTATVQVWYVKD